MTAVDPITLLVAEPDRTRRGLLLAALLADAVGGDAVVVGGFAVEAWTRGGYVTADLNLVCRRREEALAWLRTLGFEQQYRHLLHPALGLAVEIPGTVLDQGRDAYDHLTKWSLGAGHSAQVLSLEDTIVDRLCAWVHGGATGERENVLRLLSGWRGRLDTPRLDSLAQHERVAEALNACRDWVEAHGPIAGEPS